MALIVETGAGLTNSNSYATVAEATTYHADHGNADWARSRKGSTTLTLRAQPVASDKFTAAGVVYNFVSGAPAAANDVRIGANTGETATNLTNAINYEGAPGTQYHAGTTINPEVSAAVTATSPHPVVTLTARKALPGSIALAESITNPNVQLASASIVTTDDFEDALIKATTYLDAAYGTRWLGNRTSKNQALDWPREGAVDWDGYEIDRNVLPQKVKDACCEVALEILKNGDLLPTLQPSDTGMLQAESISVGPISISETFVGGKSLRTQLPRVTAMLNDVTSGSSETVRG